ncbi:MBOAT family O-acyltransferase [Helicobacter cholecystus]|uniref:MBOAT family O-acyltransferase n=1 Tax=Helicobacter cholecystus TaxID=45498 RepID=UPI00267B0B94
MGGGAKRTLIVGIIFNLLLLGGFKYTDFILSNLNSLGTSFPLPHILLPLALSFITFQQIAFLIDTYKSEKNKPIDWLDYSLFITFFPQLIAGPIVHHKEMMPQFASLLKKGKELIDWERFARGLFIFSIGLFKKVVIADGFSVWADNGFAYVQKGGVLNFFESWATSLSYTLQLYFDFSGYCDMAIGIALFFGITLPLNFNSPYKAGNIKEFWKRWHMTLGRFLTQYLYIPLGGNRRGLFRELSNIFIVFTLSGIWHGAGWGFIIWGILHAIAMVLHRIYSFILKKVFGIEEIRSKIYTAICWIITFNFINLSWVFFRSENVSGAMNLLKGMAGGGGVMLPEKLQSLYIKHFLLSGNQFFVGVTHLINFSLFITLSIAMIKFQNNKHSIHSLFYSYFMGCIFMLSLCFLSKIQIFIYFNF